MIRVPNRPQDLAELALLQRPVTLIVLTSLLLTPDHRSFPDRTWLRVLDRAPPPGFQRVVSADQRFLRWVVLRATYDAPYDRRSSDRPIPRRRVEMTDPPRPPTKHPDAADVRGMPVSFLSVSAGNYGRSPLPS